MKDFLFYVNQPPFDTEYSAIRLLNVTGLVFEKNIIFDTYVTNILNLTGRLKDNLKTDLRGNKEKIMQFVVVSVVLIIVGSLWGIAGIIINKKFYENVRKEEHQERGKIIQNIMKTYTLVQCIIWPIVMIVAWILYANKFVFTILQPSSARYLLITLRFVFTMFRAYIGFNSLSIAVCRYIFIVYENRVFKFGIKQFRLLIISLTIATPITFGVLHEILNPVKIAWICMFMPTTTNQTHNLVVDHDNVTAIFCSRNQVEDITESIVHITLNEHLSPSLKGVIRTCHTALIAIIGFNLLEGFMYGHTFAYMRR